MIFFIPQPGNTIHLLLVDKDVKDLRNEHTMVLDKEMLDGQDFNGVVILYAKDTQEAYSKMRQAGMEVDEANMRWGRAPFPQEAQCEDCCGVMPAYQVNNGRCILCWRKLALKLMGQSN